MYRRGKRFWEEHVNKRAFGTFKAYWGNVDNRGGAKEDRDWLPASADHVSKRFSCHSV